jgi:hypothetical protein
MKTILVDAWNSFINENGIDQELYSLLERYPNPKLIVTNADDDQMIKFGLDNVPYPVFTLKHNPDKVDPLYFATLLQSYNFTHEDVVYFEHNHEAVMSAQSLHIPTFHYKKWERDLKKLEIFLNQHID